MAELETLRETSITAQGNQWYLHEVICVYDHGKDDSPRVLRELSAEFDWLKVIWLSRNYGQHPATLAGISASGGDWIVTIDEDGQQDPRDISKMLDTAISEQATLVYAKPLNPPPHGFLRNIASRMAKKTVSALVNSSEFTQYNSFRLILGEVARSASAYAGSGVYLDVALGWVSKTTTCGVHLREEMDRVSGYSFKSLIAHFGRLLMSSGTRSLRMVSLLGLLTAFFGVMMAIAVFINKFINPDVQVGWSSIIITVLLTSGAVLTTLGVIAEYLGVAVGMAMGRPLYLVTTDPKIGPLGFPRVNSQQNASQDHLGLNKR